MAADLNTVIKQLTESSIIAQGKLENFVPPKAQPKSAEELVAQLVKEKHLTQFQATQIKAGKAKALILGNYTILDKIGAGGMGQVFKAEHRRLKRVVALKMLPPSVTKNALAVARFQREVEAAAKLRHTNIVATDDADQAGAVHFLVMEYIDGKDLSAIVKRDGLLPVNKAVNYILQAARGLEFAHSKGVVHRDIKPANLLLGSDGVVKILDMGLARIEQADGGAQSELTGTGTIMGTVDYMSPEQALNTRDADQRADIYSLGMSLYYLLAGKAAYAGETAMQKLMAHQNQPIPSLQDVQTTVPKQLDAVFKKMVAKKIEQRYQAMSDVVEALEGLGYGGSGTMKQGEIASTIDLSSADRKKLIKAKKPLGSITEVVASEKSKNLIFKIVGGSFGTIIAPILVFYLIRHLEKPQRPSSQPAAITPAATAQPVEVATNTTTQPPQIENGKAAQQVESTPSSSDPSTAGFWEGDSSYWKFDSRRIVGSNESVASGLTTYLCSRKAYRDFEFRCQVRLIGGDTGVMIRSQYLDREKFKLRGPQADISATGWGNLYGQDWPGATKSVSRESVNPFVRAADFNDLVIRCVGKHVTIRINGHTTVDEEISTISEEGLIGLQLYAKNTKVEFRNLALSTLDASQPETTVATTGKPSVSPIKPTKPWETPEFKKWVADTQKLSAEQQIEAVRQKLMKLNPGFDGKMVGPGFDGSGTPKIKQGVVTEIGFYTDQVTDISPVRALAGLKALGCKGNRTPNGGKLSDLSPLEGMPLTFLVCYFTKVSDLSPLKQAKLTYLHCGRTQVTDLTPLAGMPLTYLAIANTKFSDLTPLKGLPLTNFHCMDTPVSDLLPLEDCKSLTHFHCVGIKVTPAAVAALQMALPNCKIEWDDPAKATKPKLAYLDPAFQKWVTATQALPAEQQIEAVSKKLMELNPGFEGKLSGLDRDLRPQGSPKVANGVVVEISFSTDDVTDLSPIRAFSGLKVFCCKGVGGGRISRLSDLSPLVGMELTKLNCFATEIADLSPLSGMPLTDLHCHNSNVSDLSPLAGMPIKSLLCDTTKVTDLSPLRGTPLTQLRCNGTPVADLSPLRDCPRLDMVWCVNTHVSDLSPLAELKNLYDVAFTPKNITKGLDLLRQKKTLITLRIAGTNAGSMTPVEFWKKFDAGEFGTPAIKQLAYLDPAFQKWVADTQKLPAEQQIEAVSKKLMELNPGFDGRLWDASWNKPPTVQRGMVTELAFNVDHVADLSPLRVFTGLKGLNCNGTAHGTGVLADLSPLVGMRLERLGCNYVRIADFSPLAGMPLTRLVCTSSDLSDLSPLRGMALIELSLNGSSQVAQLLPLRGMPLRALTINNTRVADLSPLLTCSSLELLTVHRTGVTAKDIAALQKALPNCRIEWDDPAKASTSAPAAAGKK